MKRILNEFAKQFDMVKENPNSTRSTALTLGLHSTIHEIVADKLGSDYQVFSQKNREQSVVGAFLTKKADIAIAKDGKILGVIEVKAIRSSYKKNATNYFYNMIGETSNLQTAGIPVCQLILIPSVVKTKVGAIQSVEIIGDTQLQKYKTLDESPDSFSKPKKTIVSIVDVDYNSETTEVKCSNLQGFSKDMKEFLSTSGNDVVKEIEAFLEETVLTQT